MRSAAPLLAAFAAGTGAFVLQNGHDLAVPDYGPGAKAACAEVASAGLRDRLAATFDLHDPAVDWYCDSALPLWSGDPAFTDAMRRIPMLHGEVMALDPAVLAALAASRPVVVTRPDRLESLRDLAGRAGVPISERAAGTRIVVEVR